MKKKCGNLFKLAAEYSFYLFVFLLPWQTKLILFPAENNFKEISLYVSYLILFFSLICFFVYKIIDRDYGERLPEIWYFLAGLELFIFFSFFFASDQLLAFYHYLIFLLGLGLFYMLREGTEQKNYQDCCLDKARVLYSLISSVFLQALLGMYQFLTQSSFACKYLGLAQHDPQTLGTAVIETASGRWLRAYGGLDHPNILGGVLAVTLIFAAYLLAKKKLLNSAKEVGESILLFVFYFFGLFALLFTFSRTAWLAFIVSLIILLIIFIRQKDSWVLGRYLAIIFFSLILVTIAIFPYHELLQTRLNASGRLEQKSLVERKQYLWQAKDLIQKNWLFGVGIGNYTTTLERQNVIKKTAWDYQPVHDVFLYLWAESGVFSLIFFLGFLFFLVRKGRGNIFSAAIFGALIILMLFDHWLFSLPFGVMFLFLILGLI
ncbi:MAG: O-antigen ligase family protein [Patescibacteria group bacterium]